MTAAVPSTLRFVRCKPPAPLVIGSSSGQPAGV
jgi:hypothetical protein